ncbi:MAG: hypothetical protein M3015_14465, partial [Bacteroidota bacterium]|nr:hypothetical protein [Bacteroidota bacterium]
MLHKRIQIDYPEGSIEIQFNVKHNGQNTSIETIQIHSNFPKIQLPFHATLEQENNEWVLFANYQTKENGQLIPVKEQVKNKYSNDIIIQLLKIRDEEIAMLEALGAAQKKSLLTHYRPDDLMTKGINKEYSIKGIYQYMPKYLEWCIKYWEEFEIDINDFKNLPNPTIPNPEPIPSENRLKFYPNIEYSIKGILNYIKEGGITKEIKFNFSNETIEILELKRKGQYTAPEFIKPVAMSSEEVDRRLYTLEGTFYA